MAVDVAAIAKQSDQLHDEVKLIEDYDLLKKYYQNGGVELQWRFAQACRARSKSSIFSPLTCIVFNDAKGDKHKIKELTAEGLEAAKLAVESNDKNADAHMVWLGIFYDQEGQLSGINKRIENAFKVREEFEKAIELDPKDAGPYHCMGVWCHEVASLGKIERAFATAFFRKPPESSYEDAIKNFEKSIELWPMRYCDSYARLAECYAKLKDKENTKKYADIVLAWKRGDDEAKEVSFRLNFTKFCRRRRELRS
ncbi:unnamed protein product [Dibothriocephalus latus]|uniref:Regulator of microtubule dynamics protein 1 n=1 Tax=Dibothriocephalus latus TaxID=60516 RepID=A0A3P7P6R2_DIBLA|nr:unnamed protein product [Dibothriocephalus latus]